MAAEEEKQHSQEWLCHEELGQVLGGGGYEMGAEMGREHGRFLDLGEGRLNNGKA
jgi:hypothetical protein